MHIDVIFFLLLVGAAAILRWLSQRGEEKTDETATTRRATPPARADSGGSEEERIRKFLEALGQPTTSMPPPKVRPRAVVKIPQAERSKPPARRRRAVFPP